jgi:pimeloyl-ACP methyl ester carboxylesterase
MQLAFANGEIQYKIQGQGPAIVLLHGFMENARIWRTFLPKLTSKFTVIRVNLPGHGKSSVFSETHTMDFMASAVNAVLEAEKIQKCMIVGHSMGGYVALALAEQFPEKVNGMVLFSSISFADNAERKKDRERASKAADSHKMKFITSVIPNLFFERTGIKASKRIVKLVKIASKQPKEGIIAAINGMRARPDRTSVLKSAKFPVLILAGHDDMLIPFDQIEIMAANAPTAKTSVLENCGHVGFLEQRKASLNAIYTFALEKIL